MNNKVNVMRKEDNEIFIVDETTGEVYCLKRVTEFMETYLVLYDKKYVKIKFEVD